MSTIVLDISANTHKNDIRYLKKMIDAVAGIDSHLHEVVIKHQLYLKIPPNLKMDRVVFHKAYTYARAKGYKTTASVFDLPSLDYLMQFSVPYIKIACNSRYYYLVDEIPRKYKVLCSGYKDLMPGGVKLMCCVPQYPAKKEEYTRTFTEHELRHAISDHTVGLELWNEYKPLYFEKHFVLHKDKADNPDSGPFSVDISDLRTLL